MIAADLVGVRVWLPCTSADELEPFLPDVWKAEDATEPLPHRT
jgi:hypothetical protein